ARARCRRPRGRPRRDQPEWRRVRRNAHGDAQPRRRPLGVFDLGRQVEDRVHRRRVTVRVALVAIAATLAAAPGAQAAFPSLYVDYKTEDCTIRFTNDAGANVTTVAPGTYQIVITTSDPFGVFGQTEGLRACRGFVQFRLTGPGVSVYTTLDYGDGASEIYPATFQPGATYTLQDDNNI